MGLQSFYVTQSTVSLAEQGEVRLGWMGTGIWQPRLCSVAAVTALVSRTKAPHAPVPLQEEQRGCPHTAAHMCMKRAVRP